MLFPPWLTGEGGSENAFGSHLQAAGPALIIVMVFTIIIFIGIAFNTSDRRYLIAALAPSIILLAIYIVKAGDVSDLADLYNQLAVISLVSARVSTGAGVWVGLIFSFLTLLFLLLALGLKWGMGETLVYPAAITTPQDSRKPANYPPPPVGPPPGGSTDSQKPPSQ
ncbi:hypothetical protein [Streptomyces sp. NPDC001381]|uniref:hypothetical protein n=1 Tax=Streptomyces sp. NPDC001381 TaxID=3364567 RepID=UPI00369EE2C3